MVGNVNQETTNEFVGGRVEPHEFEITLRAAPDRHGEWRSASADPAGEQTQLPRSLGRHRGACRSDLFFRPDDGSDEGAGDDVTAR